MTAIDSSLQMPDEHHLAHQSVLLKAACEALRDARDIHDDEKRALAIDQAMADIIEIAAEQAAQVVGLVTYANEINKELYRAEAEIDDLTEEVLELEYETEQRREQLRHERNKIASEIANTIMRVYGVPRALAYATAHGLMNMGVEHDYIAHVDAFMQSVLDEQLAG